MLSLIKTIKDTLKKNLDTSIVLPVALAYLVG